METEQFNELALIRAKEIIDRLTMKGREYARGGDHLSSFKRAAALLSVTPVHACIGSWVKHIVSVVELTNDYEKGLRPPLELWIEKLGDIIAYAILMEALVTEEEQCNRK